MIIRLIAALPALLLAWQAAQAHFLELIPSRDVLVEGGEVQLELTFTHPMETGPAMTLERPARVGARVNGETVDLGPSLETRSVDGVQAWTGEITLREPGAAVIFVAPQPYWEPAEGKFIRHYAKAVVDGWASGEGWDEMIGLPVEIEPLTRPTGFWTGNVFRGIVRRNGEPVPFAEIEVEHRSNGAVAIPNDAFVTQVIKADQNGVFAYAPPRAGWWGFAALTEAADRMTAPDGRSAPIEDGGLFWLKATDMEDAQ